MSTATELPRSRNKMVGNTLRAELIKLVTLPALYLTASGTWAGTLVLDVAFVVAAGQGETGAASTLDVGLAPVGYAQVGFIIFGILAATSEYHGGQIRTSLTSVPRRIELQTVKALTLALTVVPLAAVAVIASVLIAQLALADTAGPIDLHRTVRAVAGATAYLALTALLAAAVATVMRRSLPAVAVLLGYYLIVGPTVRNHLAYAAYLPDSAGYSMWFAAGAETDGSLSQPQGFVVVTAWTLIVLAGAAVRFQRRDC